MAKVHETLRKKSDLSIEVYPNIENENIPNGVVTGDKLATNTISTGKLANGCVTTNKLDANAVIESKIADGSISTGKIINNAVTNDKLASNSVGTSNIINGSITQDKIQAGAVGTTELANESVSAGKINDTLWKWFKRIENTYLIYVGDSDDTMLTLFGTFTADENFNEYTEEDIYRAFDFDKPLSSDWDSTDLRILHLFIDSLYKNSLHGTAHSITINDLEILMYKFGTYYYITLKRLSTNTILFNLQFDSTDFSIISYTYDKYIYCNIIKLIDENAEYER